jgi:hypothetical protein
VKGYAIWCCPYKLQVPSDDCPPHLISRNKCCRCSVLNTETSRHEVGSQVPTHEDMPLLPILKTCLDSRLPPLGSWSESEDLWDPEDSSRKEDIAPAYCGDAKWTWQNKETEMTYTDTMCIHMQLSHWGTQVPITHNIYSTFTRATPRKVLLPGGSSTGRKVPCGPEPV